MPTITRTGERKRRAGWSLTRTAPLRKHLGSALDVSPQRASQMARGRYPLLETAYELVEKLARHPKTTATPIGADLVTYGTEVGCGELETTALLRELAIRIEALRDGAEAALEVAGIVALLEERGLAVHNSTNGGRP